jgi:hypothetical protein
MAVQYPSPVEVHAAAAGFGLSLTDDDGVRAARARLGPIVDYSRGPSSVWVPAGALWLALVLLCCGCASPSQRTGPPANPAEVAVHLSTTATPDPTGATPSLELTLQTVVILQEAGLMGRRSYWDEYVTTVAAHGTVPVTVEAAELIDGEGKSVVPGDNPWALANRHKPWFEQTDSHGVISAGRIGFGAVAVGAVGAPLVAVGLYAPCLLTWGTYGVAAAVLAPLYAVKAAEFNAKGRKQVEADFNRRRLALPVSVAPGQVLQGSWYFPVTPAPRQLVVRYRSAGGAGEVTLALPPLAKLHIKPGAKSPPDAPSVSPGASP